MAADELVEVVPFDDADPEDGWDASDLVVDLLDNISLRIADLLQRDDRERRVAALLTHIAFIRLRIDNGDL
jgi:hypothetical protein